MSQIFKCDICGAPATVHLTQIINGKIQKIHLCEHCAGKKISGDDVLPPLMKIMETIAKKYNLAKEKAAEEKNESPENSVQSNETRCPKCGMTASLFEKEQRLGCPQCYEVFAEKIDALLPEIQSGKNYVGKTKKSVPAKASKKEKKSADELRALLKKAVAAEDFSLAATLRDELRELEKKSVPAKKTESKSKKKASPRSGKSRSRTSKKSSPDGGKKS